jgi:CRP/FNR family transcriptional regulator, cyclic AMP receptor protein
MGLWDLVGFFAAALVLVAFVMRDVVPLRVAALCSNLAFIAYGFALNLPPVLLLHTLLLPVNGCRLIQELRGRCRPRKCSANYEPAAKSGGSSLD